jgi:competence protein ComEC
MKLLNRARQPFLGLTLVAALGIAIGDIAQLSQWAVILAAAMLGATAALLWWRPNVALTYLFVASSFFVLHNLRTTATPGLLLASRLGERPRVLAATGTVATEPKAAPNGTISFLLRLENVELEGKKDATDATILVRWKSVAQFGDELRLFGTAAPVSPPRNPGEFDMRSYLARRDVRRGLFARYEEDGVLIRHGGGNAIMRLAHKSRDWLQRTLCRGLDDSPQVKEFLSGITLGLRHQTPEDIEEPFQQTGTLHLFAVAGLHVGIVAELLWILARAARFSRKWAAAFIIPLVFFYSAVTGLHVSSLRAAVMSAVFLGGFVAERRVFNLNSLAAAAMILLSWNTNELFSTGFQLSFAVVGSIVLLADPLTKIFGYYTAPDPFLPRSLISRWRRSLHESLLKLGSSAAVSIAAWIGSLVLLFWYFHLLTPISLIANLAVVPIAFFILAVALLSILAAAFLPALSIVFNNANWLLARSVLGLVHFFAQIPAGHYYLPHPPGLGRAEAKINVLDVGSGAAIHVQTRTGDWLFDCGSERDYNRVVREYLHARGVNRLDGLLLSHGDASHIGGAAKLISELPPSLLVDNPVRDRSSVHRRLRRVFAERGLTIGNPVQGDCIPIGSGLTCSVLYPPRDFFASAGDDQTFVVRLESRRGHRILFMSDSGIATEVALLASAFDLRSDVVVKGQHHSGVSGSAEFLQAVRPELIIATSRDFPAHERVNDEWSEELHRRGITLFRQDQTGAVELSLRPDGWEARSYLTGEIFRSSSR